MDNLFEGLVGKTLTSIVKTDDDYEMLFTLDDGIQYKMYHDQDCCENVSVESIVGDLSDVMGSPILLAEEVTQDVNDGAKAMNEYDDSFTWTFYKLSTIKGSVTIRWYGTSNGYYSESVSFVKV